MPRWLVLIALLPQCTGCLCYAYPTVSHTPELTVPNQDGSVHAFRADIDRTERKPHAPTTQFTLSKIPVDARGVIASQLEVAHASGVYNPLSLTEGVEHERSDYTLHVRIYRPGFRTEVVKAWEKSRQVPQVPAPELLAQEKAIDDLLTSPDPLSKGTWWELKDEKSPGLGIQPGAVSPSQRDALLFAASEYQRLANGPVASALNMQAHRERFQQKAIWLRRYAEQAPTP